MVNCHGNYLLLSRSDIFGAIHEEWFQIPDTIFMCILYYFFNILICWFCPSYIQRQRLVCIIFCSQYKEHFSSNGRRLLDKAKDDKILLSASLITIRDFLNQYYEISRRYLLVKYIPSLGQLRKYPYESLCMMLNAQKEIKGLDTDKYYNFDLIIKTCLKEE